MQPGGRKRAPANNQLLRHNTTTDASSKNLRPGKLYKIFSIKNSKNVKNNSCQRTAITSVIFPFFFVKNFL